MICSLEKIIMENDKVYRNMEDLVRSLNDKLAEVRVGVVRKSIEREKAFSSGKENMGSVTSAEKKNK